MIYTITDLHLNKVTVVNPNGKERVTGKDKYAVWTASDSCQGRSLIREFFVREGNEENSETYSYSKSGENLKFSMSLLLGGRQGTDKYLCTLMK